MAKLQSSTLRPGLLVSLSCTVRGNVTYRKMDLESEITAEGASVARWETVRTITDVTEHERGNKARADARNAITAVCSHSAFGLLCPEANADKLESAVQRAREIADRFNASASLSRLNVYVLTGRIAPDDVEAVRAINSEIRDLMAAMETGLKNLDAKQVREAANKARAIGSMLTESAQERVQEAIAVARKAATAIVKAGEQGSIAIDNEAIARVAESRIAFLDLDDAQETESPVMTGRALDLSPCDETQASPIMCAPSFDMEG